MEYPPFSRDRNPILMRLIENESRLVGMKFEMLVELSPKRSGAGLDTFDIPGAKRRGTASIAKFKAQVELSCM
jgi:hypothetical protein